MKRKIAIERNRMVGVRRSRGRSAVAELVATVLVIAVTLVATAVAFSFVNSQAGAAENRYNSAVQGSVNCNNELFSIVQTNVSSDASRLSIWIYNNGAATFEAARVELYNSTMNILYTNGQPLTACSSVASLSGSTTVTALNTARLAPHASPELITVALPNGNHFTIGSTYFVVVQGIFGGTLSTAFVPAKVVQA